MRISENFAFIPLLEPADWQSAGSDLDSVNMGLLHSLCAVIQLGAITGNDTVIKAYSGASAGTKTTALAFKYRLSGADQGAAGADQFGDISAAVTAATGLVFTNAADYSDRLIVIEIDSDEMTAGEPWLTIEIDDGSASGLFLSALGIGVPRYKANDVYTVI